METDTPPDSHAHQRSPLQFSLRALLLLMLVVSLFMGWVAVKIKQTKEQQAAVEAIKKAGGVVHSGPKKGGSSPVVGVWGRVRPDPRLDESEVQRLRKMGLLRTITDAELEYVGRLTELKQLDLEGCAVTDAGLKSLKRLTQLKTLDVRNTQVTEDGVRDLQQALPNCRIER